jgi:hypothetical protein
MKSRLIATQQLTLPERDAMYSLLGSHFEGVKREVFDTDLENKNWVIWLEDESERILKGFSTLSIYETEFEGEILTVVYSGDTIMDPSAWSSSVLSRTWIASVDRLRLQYPRGKFYWLLISSGYRTYRFLPTFWQEFYPRYDRPAPPEVKKLIDFLASDRFGNCYDRATGIVRFPHPHTLRRGLKGIPPERLQDPHINFFNTQNPGHLQGDELVCLTEIQQENLTPAGKRMWFANTGLRAA